MILPDVIAPGPVAVAELVLSVVATIIWSILTGLSISAILRMRSAIEKQRSIVLLLMIDILVAQMLVRSVNDVFGLDPVFVAVSSATARGVLAIAGLAILLTWRKAPIDR